MTIKVDNRLPLGIQEILEDRIPDQGFWSQEDYLWLTDHTRRLVEFSDGKIEELPMPTDNHQSLLAFLFMALHGYLEPRRGKVQFAALRVELWPGKIREPDLVALRSAIDERRQDRYWTGADFVLEVVSADDPRRDLVVKRREYAKAGIPEYWIVDPRNETVRILYLEGTKYRQAGRYRRGQTAESVTLEGFSVDVSELFDAE